MIDYVGLATTVRGVMASVKQADIKLVILGDTANASKPWLATSSEASYISIDAVAFAVERQYVDNDAILSTDLEITCGDIGYEINTSDFLIRIGTTDYRIVNYHRIPEAGPVAAWTLFVR